MDVNLSPLASCSLAYISSGSGLKAGLVSSGILYLQPIAEHRFLIRYGDLEHRDALWRGWRRLSSGKDAALRGRAGWVAGGRQTTIEDATLRRAWRRATPPRCHTVAHRDLACFWKQNLNLSLPALPSMLPSCWETLSSLSALASSCYGEGGAGMTCLFHVPFMYRAGEADVTVWAGSC